MNTQRVKELSRAKRQAQERVRQALAWRHDAHQAAQQADHEYQAALAALEEADAALDAAIDDEEER
jgi:hypothetical protein